MKSFYPKIAMIFLLIISASAFAQENCNKIQQTSDDLLNLRLGMTADEVNQKLGKSLNIKIKKDDDFRFFQNYIGKKPPKNLSGIRAIYLRFFKKKLYQIEIFYEENKYSAEIKEFVEVVSNKLNLPANEWKFAHRQAVLKCGESSLKIDYQLNPRIELTDESAKQEVDKLK